MTDTTDNQLEMRWVPVTDEAGRTRMEAVWIVADRVRGHHATPPDVARPRTTTAPHRGAVVALFCQVSHPGNINGPRSVTW